jgi:hypothetical protein
MYQAAAATTMTAAAMATTATVEAAMITPPVSPAQDRRNPCPPWARLRIETDELERFSERAVLPLRAKLAGT